MTRAKAKLQVWARGIGGVLLVMLGVFGLVIILKKPGISDPWEYVELAVYTMLLMGAGVFMLKSARDRQAQIRQTPQETEREGMGREVPSPGESLQLVPPEPWHKRAWGIVAITVLSGLLVELLKFLFFPKPHGP